MNRADTAVETPLWSPDVAAFAEEHGVAECLPRLVHAAQQVFSITERPQVYLEDDPEIADDRHIMIDISVPTLAEDEAQAAHDHWTDALFRLCPVDGVAVFRLRLDYLK